MGFAVVVCMCDLKCVCASMLYLYGIGVHCV